MKYLYLKELVLMLSSIALFDNFQSILRQNYIVYYDINHLLSHMLKLFLISHLIKHWKLKSTE